MGYCPGSFEDRDGNQLSFETRLGGQAVALDYVGTRGGFKRLALLDNDEALKMYRDLREVLRANGMYDPQTEDERLDRAVNKIREIHAKLSESKDPEQTDMAAELEKWLVGEGHGKVHV